MARLHDPNSGPRLCYDGKGYITPLASSDGLLKPRPRPVPRSALEISYPPPPRKQRTEIVEKTVLSTEGKRRLLRWSAVTCLILAVVLSQWQYIVQITIALTWIDPTADFNSMGIMIPYAVWTISGAFIGSLAGYLYLRAAQT